MFCSKDQVVSFVMERSMVEGKPFIVTRSDSRRFVVQCPDIACDFIISFYQSTDGFFRIHFEVDHTCELYVPNIKRKWLAEKVQILLSERRTITPREVVDWVHEKYGFYPRKNMVSRVICEVKKGAFGDKSPFGVIRSFFEEMKVVNGGCTTSLTAVDGHFQRAFLALGICVKAFRHTPRVVGLDACHVKAQYGGALLVMTILDGNGQVFPGALAVTESENVQTWRWFLELVKTAFALGDGYGVVFLSDREKGIDIALNELLPNASHSFCVYHMMKM